MDSASEPWSIWTVFILGCLGALIFVLVLRFILVVYLKASTGKKTFCPRCGTTLIQPSSAHNVYDKILRVIGFPAYRCKICDTRFRKTPLG